MQNKQLKSSPKKLEYMKKYRQKNLEKITLSSKRYYNSHKDQMREYRKKYQKDNAKIISEKRKDYSRKHSEEIAAYQKIYREDKEHHAKHILCHRQWKERVKIDVFSHYSPNLVCQHCGYSDIRALTLDHINSDGTEQKLKAGVCGGHSLYCWVKKNKYPPIFQVLCMNCQWIKRHVKHEWYWKRINV